MKTMLRRSWWVLPTAITLVGGCGGGEKAAPAEQPPPQKVYYSDVRGYGVLPGAERVEVGQWPSWLHEQQVVAACVSGEAFYADRCWQGVGIDTDTGSVTFVGTNGVHERLALGEPVPTALGSMLPSGGGTGACFDAIDGWSCAWPHHAGKGYVSMAGPYTAGVGYWGIDVWDFPMVGGDGGRPTKRSPWAIGSEIGLRAGVVAGFLVKTTQFYGFVATKEVPTFTDFRVAHNWNYSGSVRVGGTTLPLPLRLSSVATATGAVAGRTSDGSSYIDLAEHKVRFVAQKQVMEARATWGGTGAGLSDDDLVTSIELQSEAMSLP